MNTARLDYKDHPTNAGYWHKNRNTYTALLECKVCENVCHIQGVSGRIYYTSKNVPLFHLHRYNQTSLYPTMKDYGDSDTRKMWFCCGSVYCTRVSVRTWVLKTTAKPSHTEESVLCKVLGNLRTIFKEVMGVVAFDAEPSVFQVAIQKFKDQNIEL